MGIQLIIQADAGELLLINQAYRVRIWGMMLSEQNPDKDNQSKEDES
jgi:hypothetical protein